MSGETQAMTGMRQRIVRAGKAGALCAALLLPLSAESAIYSTSYSYDVPNGIVTRTDPNGTDIAYHYNSVNRLSKVVLDAGGTPSELNYYYDLTDQLERQTYPGGEQLYTYDEFDRLQTVADFGPARCCSSPTTTATG